MHEIALPTADNRETRFTAASGQHVAVHYIEEDLFEIRLPAQPNYVALLFQRDTDDFDLDPAPGVFAVGGIGMTVAHLHRYY